MFDLEKEIKQWLRSFNKHQAFDHGSIREMELHLRDHIDDLVAQGHDAEQAFQLAVADFGSIDSMAREEFQNIRRKRSLASMIHAALVRNFYFTATRQFFKHRNYFLINISGLAIGIACFIMISLYVVNELSYDHFHSKTENIYRVNTKFKNPNGSGDRATAHSPLARTMLNTYPEVVEATRVLRIGSLRIGTDATGRERYSEDGILYVDSTFFNVFDFKLVKGNPKTALVKPGSLVLTETYARKYFGNLDPIGQQITVEDDDRFFYIVTGVVADVPANSHLQFDMLISLSTGGDSWNDDRWIPPPGFHTYVVLRSDADEKTFEKKLQDVTYKYLGLEIEKYSGLTMAQWEKAGGYTGYYLIPLKDIHLYSTSTEELEPGGNITYIFMYALIAVIILFIAIFNFVNLATAQSALRAKEVGVRKVMGSTKTGLVLQFIVESVMVSLIATMLAGLLVTLAKPLFAALVGKELAFSFTSGYVAILLLLALAVVVGILAGSYPAFVLSAFQPVDVLKGTFNNGLKAGWLRNFLVVMQYTASIVIIIGTLVVYRQLDFMLTKNLGFNKDNILVIRRPDKLKEGQEAFKNALLENSNISQVAHSNTLPGRPYPERSYRHKGEHESFVFKFNHVSHTFQELMGIELVSGRFFSKEHSLDSKAVVINEAAAKSFGFADPIGQELTSPWHKGELLTIIGVVKDFNIESLHKKIEPVAMELMPENLDQEGYITVRISNDENIRETVQYIEKAWARHSKGKIFESFFFDQEYQNIYQSEITTGKVLAAFASLSIFIACLGLVALLAYTASIRKKEIGIRKILGAGIGRLINLLSAEVVRLIIIATLVAWPLAYLGTRYWLLGFVDRIEVNSWMYFLSAGIVALICGLAISFQVIRAARENPVNSLRQE